MMVTINGEEKAINSGNIYDLLAELDTKHQGKNVNVNGIMVHWTKFKEYQLREQDVIVVLNHIAGG